MGGIFSPPKPQPRPAPVAPPTPEDPAIEEARRKEVIANRKSKGRAATLLTSGTGAEGTPNVARKVLLGQ